MLIHRRKPTVYERLKLKVRLGPNAIEMVRQHKILGLITDDRLNWKVIPERLKGTSRQKNGATKDTSAKKMVRRSKNVTYNRTNDCVINFTLRAIDLKNRHRTSTENIRTDTQ
jgi:hypothetical protein